MSQKLRRSSPSVGVDPFADDLDGPAPLIFAYDLVAGEKPSLEQIIRLIRKGDLEATHNEQGVFIVPSVTAFVAAVETWVVTHPYQSPWAGGEVPTNYVSVAAFCKNTVDREEGIAVGLFQGTSTARRTIISTRARAQIRGGAINRIQKKGKAWFAEPDEIKRWLDQRFGLR